MDNQYYYKLMASYLSKRNCDESFMRYFFGKNATKKTAEELERADERKRRLQRERSRRYRALKNARRQHEGGKEEHEEAGRAAKPPPPLPLSAEEEQLSDGDEPPTLCHLVYDDKWREEGECCAHSPHSPADLHLKEVPRELSLAELLSAPNTELDYPTVHSLMFHWLQT